MEIVTGSTGAVHVTPIDDAVRNSNTGYLSDKIVMTCFRNFEAGIITNNQVRIYSGYGMNQGRYFKIDDGEFDNVTIENGSQGYKRADLIVARYTMNTQTGFEDISLAVIRGESGNNYVDPSYSTGNINNGDTSDDMPLYRVRINGLQIEGLDRLFTLVPDGGRLGELETKVNEHLEEFEAINIRTNLASESTAKLTDSSNVRPGIEGVLPASHGGTGGNTLKAGATNLIGALDANGTTPTDNEHYIGTTPSTGGFQRKPLTALWDYIRSKVRALLGMSTTDIVPISHGGTGRSSISQGKVLVGNIGGGFDELGIDSAPSSGSNNLITSKGVADALGTAGYGDMMKSTYDPNNDGIIALEQGGTGSQNGTINGVRLMKNGTTMGYYDANGDFKSFRQPTGNATAAQVLSGYTFANASSDSLSGSMANYSGNSRRTVTPSGGTGNEQIALSAGYHDSIIVNRTNPYNAGVSAAQAVTWTETIIGGARLYVGTYAPSNVEAVVQLPIKNLIKIKNTTEGRNVEMTYTAGGKTTNKVVNPNSEWYIPEGTTQLWGKIVGDDTQVMSPNPYFSILATFQAKILR